MLNERMLEKEPKKQPINVSVYRMSREQVADEVACLERIKQAAEKIDFDALLMAAGELPQTAEPRAAYIRRLVRELRNNLDALAAHQKGKH